MYRFCWVVYIYTNNEKFGLLLIFTKIIIVPGHKCMALSEDQTHLKYNLLDLFVYCWYLLKSV